MKCRKLTMDTIHVAWTSDSCKHLLVLAGLLIWLDPTLGYRQRAVAEIGLNTLDSNMCSRIIQHIHRDHITAPAPPSISGLWTSQRCEVRPGPEYLLRKYRFHNNSHFEIRQYFYHDADCSIPLYSLVARGSFKSSGSSWTVPGGYELDYHLSHVTIMPYTKDMGKYLGSKLNKSCPGLYKIPWKPYSRQEILNYVEFDDGQEGHVVMDRDCTSPLELSFHELQLVRLELRRHHQGMQKRLYLGDIHTERGQRQMYRPTCYQEPMAPFDAHGCSVCRNVANSDDYYPPRLHKRHQVTVDLPGEWYSVACETRPNGMFLTRRLLFSDDNRTWEGYFYHYADPLCRQATFTIYAKGRYVAGPPSPLIERAYHYDFKVLQVRITPEDTRMVENLNGLQDRACGHSGKWVLGQDQDVTHTGGCTWLGIKVPHVEYELLKVQKHHHRMHLFLGQRPSGGTNPAIPKMRPTSFQSPVVLCGPVPLPTPPSDSDENVGYRMTGNFACITRAYSLSYFVLVAAMTRMMFI